MTMARSFGQLPMISCSLSWENSGFEIDGLDLPREIASVTFGDVGNRLGDRNVVVPFTNAAEGFFWAEPAGRTATDVVLGEQGSLSSWVMVQHLAH